MTSKALAQVLLRILGVYFFVISLASVGRLFMFFRTQPVPRAILVGESLNVIVMFVVGVVCVRNGDQIGAWLTSDSEPVRLRGRD